MTQLSASNLQARQAALASVEGLAVSPTGLINYSSRGRVVVIGGPEAMGFAPRLRGTLQPLVLLTAGAEEPGVEVVSQGGRALRIKGHLGAFEIQLGETGRANAQTLDTDLILDLSDPPLLGMALKPPGYFTSDLDEANLDAAVESLSGMVGVFEKPVYFDYDPSICAHGRSGLTACSRCIDACPAEAILGLAESIEVDPNRCQGGGICASVCPSGAIRYAYPSAGDILTRLRRLLRVYREEGGTDPELVIYAETDGDSLFLEPPNRLPLPVEELASVGLEVWLSALAYGARAVLLVQGEGLSAGVTEALKAQLETAGEVLKGLGYPMEAVRLVGAQDKKADSLAVMPLIQAAGFSGSGGKRQTAYLALDHLFAQAEKPKLMVDLKAGAPFGTAGVRAESCTLCHACVGVCPGKALQTGEGEPQLLFIEANCLQCGLCTRSCPEDAIWISPRLLFDREERNKVRLLHQEPPFNCISCGKPFATRSVINNMLNRLQGHWMFQNERARNRLMMCENCRTLDAVQDPEAMGAALGGRFESKS